MYIVTFEIEAADPEEAVDTAFSIDWRMPCECTDDRFVDHEIDMIRRVVKGNVFSGVLNEVTVEKLKR